ncbi:hypothetical protein E4U17_002470 [Claviceps sp. LM77 group G4]|nr:hypothetical protein E4U17_002470 [Claviceps sp. LM77 group G4]
MTAQQVSPMVKLEASPAESFLSLPEDNYSSLFAPTTPSAAVNPFDIMTPQSTCTDRQTSQLPVISEEHENTTPSPEDDTSGKKQTKKRKSWGQVLPEPKTNLPPRKRAKTDDEKEQRRVERVLRNRRAAQSSRERKRLEVEALEIRNQELESQLMKAQKTNMYLMEELKRVRRDSGVTTPVSSPLHPLYDTPLALSQELFSSHDNTSGDPAVHLVDQLITSTANPTVNPASLSPELTPVPDEPNTESRVKSESSEETSSTSPDLAQHPAEMLFDLQCHTSGKVPKSFLDYQTVASQALALSIQLKLMIFTASAILSACQRPLTQIAVSLKAGFSLLPTPQLLATIIWLVTVPPTSRVRHTSSSSTWTTSSATRQTTSSLISWQRATMSLQTMASSPPSTTLKLKSLLNILACSPNLARPLLDATMEALRLVSEGCDDRVGGLGIESSGTRDQVSELTQCLRGIVLPSREILITLLWALKVEERKISQRNVRSPRRERDSSDQQSTAPTSLLLVANKMGIKRIGKRYQRKCQ